MRREEREIFLIIDIHGNLFIFQLNDCSFHSQNKTRTRIRILWILCHTNECVTDIGIAIGMSAPAVSHHLKLLKQLNLIKNNKVGKEMQYTIADTPEAKLIHKYIEDMLQISCPKKKE